ncbi:site-2 protease family protein [Streptomyces sp. NBC_01275]|uniref:site-2 protease family protein n=1 Tax=Streptomyces sp. NBC_01275 TaxID=2903807 RepID=UPI00224FC622|nr:site-2 protease family protein [Streptomyces sp. NBC_01275]MCX4760785.1 site-2 protease family protein [Streptomyces sp. NBC_01275]
MVESGGSGRPRPDNEESAEHPLTPAPQATAPAQPPGPGTQPGERPDTPNPTPTPKPTEHPTPEPPAAKPEPASTPETGAEPASGAEPEPEPTPASANEPKVASATEPEPTPSSATEPRPASRPETGAETAPATGPESVSASATDPEPASPPETGSEPSAMPETGPEPASGTEPTPIPASATEPDPSPAAAPATHQEPPPAPTGEPTARTPALTKGPPPQRPPEQPRGGLLMGRPFGVPVYVAPSWFLVAALITWVFGGQLDRVLPDLGFARYLVALFFAVAFYASVLIHELAHTIAALRFKLPVRRIQLQFFGGVSEIEKEAETPGREFWLAFVGPLLSLALAGVFYLAMQPVEPGTVPGVLLAGLMISNLIVAIFNLLPGLPLDGGRMLRAVVWKITGKPMSGTIAAAWVGRALAVSVLVGLPLLTQTGALGSTAEDSVGMDTVTDALLAAILAAIIWTGAGNSLRMARLREHLPDLRARTLTRRAVPVETNTPLSEALRRANDAGARALVVVDAHGEPLSLVREAAIVGVPEHRRPWVAVSGLAQDLTDGMRVSAELAGEDLLDVLRATPATEYLVVEETGEIYGVLSAADVERAFVKAMARPN